MNKRILSLFIASLMVFPSLSYADGATDDTEQAPADEYLTENPQHPQGNPQPEPPTAVAPAEESEPDQGKPVGQAAVDATHQAKVRRWQNIALAVGAIAIATTALILVARHDGHHN